MPRRHSPAGRQATVARERERQAFELRKAGATYQQIAGQLTPHEANEETGEPARPVTAQAVAKMIKRVLKRIAKETEIDAEEVRRLELERLDAMLLALWPQAQQGDHGAVDRVIKIGQRRAELLGLDAPKRADFGKEGQPIALKLSIVDDSPSLATLETESESSEAAEDNI